MKRVLGVASGIFAGAALSTAAGLASWPQLVSTLATLPRMNQATWGHGQSEQALTQFFQSFPLLFVGHDLESEELVDVLSRVRALAGNHPPRNFALVPSGTLQGQLAEGSPPFPRSGSSLSAGFPASSIGALR